MMWRILMKKILITLWNIISILLLLSLKIVSVILMLPVYVIMLLLTLFSPITYFISFLYALLYVGLIIGTVQTGGFGENIIGGILAFTLLAIPLIIFGSCCMFGEEAAAGLLGILAGITALPITSLIIRKNKSTAYKETHYNDDYNTHSYNENNGSNSGESYNNSSSQTQDEPTFFENCKTKEEVKDCYRKLVKIYHPDSSVGNAKMFEKIQQEYEDMLKKYV